ncbi:uncharacterized protein LOC123220852 [Mangifera indica]|uniref:uncharacterized protein LOC123220852 n=1 Tax=Mangifera indica TaxID=29780 RepID=UPI001CFA86E3|nr:uncharacterized protein LOC123220852 [Mangifera indica]
MGTGHELVSTSELYRAALNNEWESLKKFYQTNVSSLSSPVTAFGDNAFHLAVFSKREDPLQFLLEISKEHPMVKYGYLEKNVHGNTPLHEAALNGNLEAVKALVTHHRRLIEEDIEHPPEEELQEAVNDDNETPLFLAAAFGQKEVVKFLAATSLESHKRLIDQEEKGRTEEEEYSKLKIIHRQNMKVKPKRKASNEQPGAIPGEMISEPEPDASILHVAITGHPFPNSRTRGTLFQIQGEMISEPEPGAIKEETSKKKPDASILHVAIIGHHFDTALYLLNLDESLAEIKDLKGWTPLHLLATMPEVFESGYQWGTWIHRVIYFCLPVGDDADDDEKATTKISKGWLNLLGKFCALERSDIWKEKRKHKLAFKLAETKRKHKLAFKLAETLIKKNSFWDEIIPSDKDQSSEGDYVPIPLFLATENGIGEIVNEILEICPQLVEHCNNLGQNILHLAIKHRQEDIFNYVKDMKMQMTRLVGKVDNNGCTILHHAADMKPKTTNGHPAGPVYQIRDEIKSYKRVKLDTNDCTISLHAADMEPETAERHPEGPVYQLQEELKWYKRVKEIAHPHYVMFCKERFNSKHNKLLKEAQTWIKETSQSCSIVAVLVATVVFTAAYTVPGGSNEQGHPVFLNSALFLLFTVMDVLALACSLASVVMFLSILVSPYTYEEFHHKLPGKLRMGFVLLFISLTTTMISFAATILLIIRSGKPNRTTTLIYTAAFLPVSIFALMSFPMYPEFEKTLLLLCPRLSKKCLLPKKSASRQGSAAPKQTESHTKQLENDGQLSEESVPIISPSSECEIYIS